MKFYILKAFVLQIVGESAVGYWNVSPENVKFYLSIYTV